MSSRLVSDRRNRGVLFAGSMELPSLSANPTLQTDNMHRIISMGVAASVDSMGEIRLFLENLIDNPTRGARGAVFYDLETTMSEAVPITLTYDTMRELCSPSRLNSVMPLILDASAASASAGMSPSQMAERENIRQVWSARHGSPPSDTELEGEQRIRHITRYLEIWSHLHLGGEQDENGSIQPYDSRWQSWFSEHAGEEWVTEIQECNTLEEAEQLAENVLQGTGSQSVSYNLMTFSIAMICLAAVFREGETEPPSASDVLRSLNDMIPDAVSSGSPNTDILDRGTRAQIMPKIYEYAGLPVSTQLEWVHRLIASFSTYPQLSDLMIRKVAVFSRLCISSLLAVTQGKGKASYDSMMALSRTELQSQDLDGSIAFGAGLCSCIHLVWNGRLYTNTTKVTPLRLQRIAGYTVGRGDWKHLVGISAANASSLVTWLIQYHGAVKRRSECWERMRAINNTIGQGSAYQPSHSQLYYLLSFRFSPFVCAMRLQESPLACIMSQLADDAAPGDHMGLLSALVTRTISEPTMLSNLREMINNTYRRNEVFNYGAGGASAIYRRALNASNEGPRESLVSEQIYDAADDDDTDTIRLCEDRLPGSRHLTRQLVFRQAVLDEPGMDTTPALRAAAGEAQLPYPYSDGAEETFDEDCAIITQAFTITDRDILAASQDTMSEIFRSCQQVLWSRRYSNDLTIAWRNRYGSNSVTGMFNSWVVSSNPLLSFFALHIGANFADVFNSIIRLARVVTVLPIAFDMPTRMHINTAYQQRLMDSDPEIARAVAIMAVVTIRVARWRETDDMSEIQIADSPPASPSRLVRMEEQREAAVVVRAAQAEVVTATGGNVEVERALRQGRESPRDASPVIGQGDDEYAVDEDDIPTDPYSGD